MVFFISAKAPWLFQHAMCAAAGRNRVLDVFISHRGADRHTGTNGKKIFVSLLHARLQQAGIRSFLDESSLAPGRKPWKTMLQAMRHCTIATLVLSESYGNSVWCLRELTEMVKAKLYVMPLFLGENSPAALTKMRARSCKLAGQAKPGELQAWQEAIDVAGSGWMQHQTSGCAASMLVFAHPLA